MAGGSGGSNRRKSRPETLSAPGDAFTAALVWRLLRGEDLGEACRWAVAAGAANALTLMPGELEPMEVERLVKNVSAVKV